MGQILSTEDGQAVSESNPLPVTATVTGGATETTLAALNTATGAKNDAVASTDTGTFSIIALIKRGLQNWTTLLAKIPALGAAAKAAAIPVTMATDQPAMSVTFPSAQSVTFPSAQQVSVTNVTTVASGSVLDSLAAGISLDTIGFNYGYNGASWDRLRVDTAKNLKVTTEYVGVHYAVNGTNNAIKTGAGVLHSITINTKGASANTISVYDGLTSGGTLLANIDSTDQQKTLIYDAIFTTGLTIVIATGTAADITVSYR